MPAVSVVRTLNYTAPSSSGGKAYVINLNMHADDQYTVTYMYGAINSALREGSKTKAPVSKDKAEKIIEAMHKDRLKKGYEPNSEGATEEQVSALTSDKATTVNRAFTQPLYQVFEETDETYLTDSNIAMQEKHNGERRPVLVDGDTVSGFGRYGRAKPLSKTIVEALKGRRIEIDAEIVGDNLHVFDLRQLDGQETTSLAFIDRQVLLQKAMEKINCPNIHLVKTYYTEQDKRRKLAQYQDENKEGVVFRDKHKPYKAAERATQAAGAYKRKFFHEATFIAGEQHESKRSIELKLYDSAKKLISLGRVTIPQNTPIPPVGGLIEVRYLYAFAGGALHIPTFLRGRDDVLIDHCTQDQLVYKAA